MPFLIKLQASFSINYIEKETLVQVFSSDFCEIFKNIFFYRTPPVAASKKILNVLESTEFKEKNEIKFKADVLQKKILLKERLWYSRFPMNFAKFLRTTF